MSVVDGPCPWGPMATKDSEEVLRPWPVLTDVRVMSHIHLVFGFRPFEIE